MKHKFLFNRQLWLVVSILSFPVILLAVFLFRHPLQIYLEPDFLQILHINKTLRMAISNLELPLWSPYSGGGYPVVAHPFYFFWGMPLTVLPMVLGEVAGVKLNLLGMVFLGSTGMYYFSRRILEIERGGAVWVAMLFSLHPYVAQLIADGNYGNLTMMAFPLTMAMFIKSMYDKRFLIPFILLLGMALNFGVHFPCALLFILIFSVPIVIDKKEEIDFKKFITAFIIAVSTCLLFYAIHLIPFLELYQSSKRGISDYRIVRGYSSILVALFIFTVPFLLTALQLYLRPRKSIPWLIPLFISMFLMLPQNKIVPLFFLLHNLPLFNSIQEPVHYFFFFYSMSISVLSAFAIQRLLQKKQVMVVALLVIATFLPYTIIYTRDLSDHAKKSTYTPAVETSDSFFQVTGFSMSRYGLRTLHSNQYFNLLANIGTIDWYGHLLRPERVVPKYLVKKNSNSKEDFKNDVLIPNKYYKGEVYFTQQECVVTQGLQYFGFSKISIKAETNSGTTIVVNQNYHPDWVSFSDSVSTFDYKGLLGLKCNQPLKDTISIYFLPISFIIGLVISLLTTMSGLLYLFKFSGKAILDEAVEKLE